MLVIVLDNLEYHQHYPWWIPTLIKSCEAKWIGLCSRTYYLDVKLNSTIPVRNQLNFEYLRKGIWRHWICQWSLGSWYLSQMNRWHAQLNPMCFWRCYRYLTKCQSIQQIFPKMLHKATANICLNKSIFSTLKLNVLSLIMKLIAECLYLVFIAITKN